MLRTEYIYIYIYIVYNAQGALIGYSRNTQQGTTVQISQQSVVNVCIHYDRVMLYGILH